MAALLLLVGDTHLGSQGDGLAGQDVAVREVGIVEHLVVRHLDLAQSTVSQHLKVLVQAGLVIYEPTRPRSRYSLNRPALQEVLGAVSGLVNECCRTGSCQ